MSIIRVTDDDYESITIVATPNRSYVSSSAGTFGAVTILPHLSSYERELNPSRKIIQDGDPDVVFDNLRSNSIEQLRKAMSTKRAISGDSNAYNIMDSYVSVVHGAPKKVNQVREIERFTPTTAYTKYTVSKDHVKNLLMPYYVSQYTQMLWGYQNYNSLNFFCSGSLVSSSSALLYPNVYDSTLAAPGRQSGSYCLSGAFSFDFHINPKYKVDGFKPFEYRAGTIFHLSSSYAVSLVSGSKKDENGYPAAFRLMLQFSHSADVSPSRATSGVYPRDLVFLSDDNSLEWNKWHHVVVRWGTTSINDGTGSIIINGTNRGNFVIPSSSITPLITNTSTPDALCIGNYYEGYNYGVASQALFFNTSSAQKFGVISMTSAPDEGPEGPDSNFYKFTHPLKAEVHDLAIRRHYLSDVEIATTGSTGPGISALKQKDYAFYLPPFFVKDTPIRNYDAVTNTGGVLQTPFFAVSGTTDDPFNVALAFGVGAHYINLENFTKDFATGRFPRLLSLTASVLDYTTDARPADDFVYRQPGAVKRNLTILPCDDGNFSPNYGILSQEVSKEKFVDFLGSERYDLITLDNLLLTSSLSARTTYEDIVGAYADFSSFLIGPNDETPGLPPGQAVTNKTDAGIQAGVPLTLYERLRDSSSNQVTFFNISNIYYGTRILPGSFTLTDTNLSGSAGNISITLKDDSRGGLYRADSFSEANVQNIVGNIFYDEGVVVIKSPHLNFFGKNSYKMTFKGLKKIYSRKYEILASRGSINSSSNVSYNQNKALLAPSSDPNDKEAFVYVSRVNLHDKDMNVIGKVHLAQPVMKRSDDNILFKFAMDF